MLDRMSAAVATEHLTVAYGARVALDDVTISVPVATTVAVIGPNGSGKSTLLHSLAGLLTPTSGRVSLGDATVALVLQATDVDRSLPITVRETVRMARYAVRGMFRPLRAVDHAAVDDAMTRLDVDGLADRQLHELSGGQRQRVLVAQGLAQGADVLLLDEPVTGLDVVSRQVILDVIDQQRSLGRTVLMTTHSLEDARRCDLVLLLAGRAVACAAPAEVLVEGNLRAAFGGRVLRLADGEVVVDDPHHHDHAHTH